jgi:hypothetical protein
MRTSVSLPDRSVTCCKNKTERTTVSVPRITSSPEHKQVEGSTTDGELSGYSR